MNKPTKICASCGTKSHYAIETPDPHNPHAEANCMPCAMILHSLDQVEIAMNAMEYLGTKRIIKLHPTIARP